MHNNTVIFAEESKPKSPQNLRNHLREVVQHKPKRPTLPARKDVSAIDFNTIDGFAPTLKHTIPLVVFTLGIVGNTGNYSHLVPFLGKVERHIIHPERFGVIMIGKNQYSLTHDLEFTPHHFVNHTRVTLNDFHHLGRHVLIGINRHRNAMVSITVHLHCGVNGLQQRLLINTCKDEARLVESLRTLG